MIPVNRNSRTFSWTLWISISAFFAGMAIWAVSTWLLPRENTSSTPRLNIHFEWGACEERGERGILDINEAGELHLLVLASDQRTGREHDRQLTETELQELRDQLEQSSFWELPAQITSPEGAIVLKPGCSHLEAVLDEHESTIDEADGTNSKYFDLKSYLVYIAQS